MRTNLQVSLSATQNRLSNDDTQICNVAFDSRWWRAKLSSDILVYPRLAQLIVDSCIVVIALKVITALQQQLFVAEFSPSHSFTHTRTRIPFSISLTRAQPASSSSISSSVRVVY